MMTQNRPNSVSLAFIFFTIIFWFFMPQKAFADRTKDIEKAGDIVQIAIPAIAYGTTFYLDDKEGRNQFYKGFATNFAVTHSLKHAINKERPNGGNHSFPSGHTSAAFQGASFIHKRYGAKYAIPAYVGATFVGYSRVQADKHDTTDVLAGAVIGTLSSWYFTKEYDNATVVLNASPDYYGLSVHLTH